MGYASSSRRQASVNKSQDLALGSDGPTVQTDGDGAAARTPALSLLRSLGSVVRKMSGGGGRRREGEGSEAAPSSGRLDYPVDESRTTQAAASAFASAPAATKSVELVRTPMGLGLTVDSQYKVLAIAKDGQAKRSGSIAVGDQLVSINDVPLSGGGGSFEEQLGAIAVGTKVRLVIMDEAADEDYSSNYPADVDAAKGGDSPLAFQKWRTQMRAEGYDDSELTREAHQLATRPGSVAHPPARAAAPAGERPIVHI